MVVPFFISHQGCPHRCVFCDQRSIAGAKEALPDAREMLERIERYRQGSPGRELEAAFYGGTFTALPRGDQRRLLGALQPLLASGTLRSIRLSTRPDAVDADTVRFLKEMGVGTVEVGVQSLDEEVLRLSGRGYGAADAESAVRALREGGLEAGVQLMTGLPGDTPERALASLARVFALNPSFLRIYPTLVISGTKLAELHAAGSYAPQSLDEAVRLCGQMLLACRRRSLPVIRIGLQATFELDSPEVVLAGPYHPAFGQLVESELFFALMESLAGGVPPGSRVRFLAPAGRVSDVVGQGRRNLARLAERLGVSVAGVREDPALDRNRLALEWSGGKIGASLLDLPPVSFPHP